MSKDNDDTDLILGSGNIFADLGFSNADKLQFKADLAAAISRLIEGANLPQTEASRRMEVLNSKISLIMNGKLCSFSIGRMSGIAKRLGCDVHVSLQKSARMTDKMHLD